MSKDRVSAIYLITNTKNGNKYVGGTTWLVHRLSCHMSEIHNRNHKNRNIQKDLEEFGFGVSDFSFSVLEELKSKDINYITEREQFWIDKICPEYNINDVAGKYIGDYIRTPDAIEKANKKRRGRKQSQEEKYKRSESLRKYWANPENRAKLKKTAEQKKHLSEINMGENNPNWGKKRSKETKSKMSKSMSKIVYIFKHKDGHGCEFSNLVKNAEAELGIPYWVARRLYQGRVDEYNGWKFIEKRET